MSLTISFFTFTITLLALLRCLACQQPNTDAFLVSDFFEKMGVAHSSTDGSFSDVCSWKEVTCDAQRERVISLVASGIGLSGIMPETSVGKLSMLQSLDLSHNSITAFSSDFWELGTSLKTLNLSSNRISGMLPNNFGDLKSLESLDLSHNELYGEIPVAFGSLTSLKILGLGRNLIEGSIPDAILQCISLTSVDFSGNKLNGSVPVGFGVAFENLRALDLSDNDITGEMPDLSGLNSLTYLNLSGNIFRGPIIGMFQEPLQIIDLSNNQFQGHIPQVNSSSRFSWSSLIYLDISINELSGDLVVDLGEAKSLKHLNLAFNKFYALELSQLQMLTSLEYLNLSKIGLTSEIPSWITQLVNLKVLDLSGNYITGSVPDFSSENLRILDLSKNNLSGEIPQSLQDKLITLEKFNFSYNNLTFCAAQFSREVLASAFIESHNDCPIAAEPEKVAGGKMKSKFIKLGLAIALSVVFLITGFICLVYGLQKRTKSSSIKQLSYKEEPNVSGPFSFQTDSTTWVADVKIATSVPVVIFEKPLLNFTFADLLAATSNFDKGTLLAEGKFGPVYRGFLPGGIHVAVKVLVYGLTVTDKEAAKELERLGRIKHPNLVPLTGYCLAGEQRIAIYDYMENGNLQKLLHDLPLGVQTTEDWSTDTWEVDNPGKQNITTEGMTTWRFRHKIALGAARALSFLHHGCFPQIVHRDVKASSIYLDSEMEPRLADFGLSNIVGYTSDDEVSRASLGYVPPELTEQESASVTSKVDVYGFGVVLFELISGKKPVDDDYPGEKETTLVHWARALVRSNEGLRLVDPKIRETVSEKQMDEAIRIAYLCTAELPSKRPTMQQIVGLLKDIEPL